LGKWGKRQFTEVIIADTDANMIYREEVPKLNLFYFTMSKEDPTLSIFQFQVSCV